MSDSVVVPLRDGQTVELLASDLPEDVADVEYLLTNEQSPLSIWLDVGVLYNRRGMYDQAERLLDDAVRSHYVLNLRQNLSEEQRLAYARICLALVGLKLRPPPPGSAGQLVDPDARLGPAIAMKDRIGLVKNTGSFKLLAEGLIEEQAVHRAAEDLAEKERIRNAVRQQAQERILQWQINEYARGRRGREGGAGSAPPVPDTEEEDKAVEQARLAFRAARERMQTDFVQAFKQFPKDLEQLRRDRALLGIEAADGSSLGPDRYFVSAAMGRGLSYFWAKDYELARKWFADCIKANPKCGASARVALGHCLYRMGHIEPAKKCMVRALQLDQKNVHAMVGLAVLDMYHSDYSGRDEERMQAAMRSFDLLQEAFEQDQTNPMALLHLAERYFHRWIPLKTTADSVRADPEAEEGEEADQPIYVTVWRDQRVLVASAGMTHLVQPGDYLRLGEGENYLMVDVARDGPHSTAGPQGEWAEPRPRYLRIRTAPPRSLLPQSPVVLQVFVRDVERSQQLARQALHNTSTPDIQAEAAYMVGRVHHHRMEFREAHEWYLKSLQYRPNFPLVMFADVQCLTRFAPASVLRPRVEELMKVLPDSPDVLKLMTWVHSNMGETKEAIHTIRRAAEVSPLDPDPLIILAGLLSRQQGERPARQALAAYRKALKLLNQKGEGVPVGFWINIGALALTLGQLDKAERWLRTALTIIATEVFPLSDDEVLQRAPESHLDLLRDPRAVTVAFNFATLRKKQGMLQEARERYEFIFETFPDYHDAAIAIGQMAQREGRMEEAEQWFKRVTEKDPPSPPAARADAHSCLAHLALEQGLKDKARVHFEAARAVTASYTNRVDTYATIGLANLEFENVYEAEGTKAEKSLRDARRMYLEVLKADPSNLYAANGMGQFFAEMGYLEDAREVFSAVREAANETMPGVYVNLGHTLLALGEVESGLQMYRHVLKHFYRGHQDRLELLLVLAHGCMEHKQFEECIRSLKEALRIDPSDLRIWYNMAFALTESATSVLTTNPVPPVEEAERQVAHVHTSLRIVRWLHSECGRLTEQLKAEGVPEEEAIARLPVPLHTIESSIRATEKNVPVAEKLLARIRREDRKVKDAQRRRQEELQRMEEERLQREQEEQEAEQRRRKEAQAQAEALQRQFHEGRREWVEAQQRKKEIARRRKRMGEEELAMEGEEEWDEEDEETQAMMRSRTRAQRRAMGQPAAAEEWDLLEVEEEDEEVAGPLQEETELRQLFGADDTASPEPLTAEQLLENLPEWFTPLPPLPAAEEHVRIAGGRVRAGVAPAAAPPAPQAAAAAAHLEDIFGADSDEEEGGGEGGGGGGEREAAAGAGGEGPWVGEAAAEEDTGERRRLKRKRQEAESDSEGEEEFGAEPQPVALDEPAAPATEPAAPATEAPAPATEAPAPATEAPAPATEAPAPASEAPAQAPAEDDEDDEEDVTGPGPRKRPRME